MTELQRARWRLDNALMLILQEEFMFGPDSELGDEALRRIKAAIATYVVGKAEAEPHYALNQVAFERYFRDGRNALRATQRKLLEGGE